MRATAARMVSGRPVEIQVATETARVGVGNRVLLRTVSARGVPAQWVELTSNQANELAHLLGLAAVEAQQGRGATL